MVASKWLYFPESHPSFFSGPQRVLLYFSACNLLPPSGACRSAVPLQFSHDVAPSTASATPGSKLCSFPCLSSESKQVRNQSLRQLADRPDYCKQVSAPYILRKEGTGFWATFFWLCHAGKGVGKGEQKHRGIFYIFECGFFLIGVCLFGVDLLTAFQSSYKVILVNL